MKKLLILFVIILITACSEEPPSVRVVNQNAGKANVQVKLSDANTININDVSAYTSSQYQEIKEGATIVTAVIQNEKDSPTISFNASNDKNYSIVVSSASPATLKVDSSNK